MVESADRSDPNRFHACTAHLSTSFPTCLASPFLSHGDHGQPLITCPGGTDHHTHDRWENLPSRSAPADHCKDGWRAIICRRNHEIPTGIRPVQSTRWTLRTCRVVLYVSDSCDVT